MRPKNFASRFLLPALLFATLFFSGPAPAQQTNSTPLTPAQQTYVNARSICGARYQQENIPPTQFHTFMNECMKENGVTPGSGLNLPPDAQPTVTPTIQPSE